MTFPFGAIPGPRYAAEGGYGPPEGISASITPERLEELRRSPPSDLSDEDLVHLIQHGETALFDILVERYQDRIYNTSMKMLADPDEALDATQEVFMKAFRGLGRFAFKSTFYTWLFQITLNFCRSRLRSRSRASRMKTLPLDAKDEDGEFQAFSLPDDGPQPFETLQKKELLEAAERALELLRPEFREVIVLRDIEGLNYDQIAIVLKCSMGTVKSRLHRARNALARALAPYLERE